MPDPRDGARAVTGDRHDSTARRWRDEALRLLAANRQALGAIAIKLISAFFSFLLIFIVARTTGAAVTGDYALAVATANMAALVATFGLDQILVRTIGGDLREGRPEQAWATLRTVIRFVVPVATLSALLLAALSGLAPMIGATPRTMALIAISVPAFPMLRIAVMVLRASGSVLWSQAFDGLVHTILILGLVLIGSALGGALDAGLLAAFYSGAIIAVTILAWAMLMRRVRHWPRHAALRPKLIRTGWPILIAAVVHVLTQWIVLAQLGAVMGPVPVGAFRVGSQVVMVIAVMLTTIESMVNPLFAGDFRIGDIQGAWIRHRRASALMLVSALAPIVLCLMFPRQVLALFGPEFGVAAPALVILAVGQVVNILTGPIGGMMVMSGHEHLSLKLSLAGLAVAVSMAFVLIPVYGLVGAALASTSALILRNGIAYHAMHKALPLP